MRSSFILGKLSHRKAVSFSHGCWHLYSVVSGSGPQLGRLTVPFRSVLKFWGATGELGSLFSSGMGFLLWPPGGEQALNKHSTKKDP